jgi:hypothetical protein
MILVNQGFFLMILLGLLFDDTKKALVLNATDY